MVGNNEWPELFLGPNRAGLEYSMGINRGGLEYSMGINRGGLEYSLGINRGGVEYSMGINRGVGSPKRRWIILSQCCYPVPTNGQVTPCSYHH